MNFLDFFAGIGGFRTGLERVGGICKGFAEIDKYARQSYKAMHDTEGELEWHDITAVTDDDFRRLRGTIDLIAGGFPCQAFSVAGKRMGFDESRGTLFFHIARAAKEIQPRYLLLENVKGLVSHDQGRTLTVILNTLQELGYGHIEWGVFNSKFWGVPQNRERIFIVAELTDEPQHPYLLDLLKDQEENGVQTRLRDILETNVDEKYYLSDEKTRGLIDKLNERDFVPHTHVVADLNHYSQEALNRVYGVNGQSPTLDTMQGGGREPKIAEPIVNCLNTWKEDGTQTRMQDRIYDSKGVSVALTSFSDRLNILLEKPSYRIRKLTPLECWRLQGFSDEQHQAASDDGVSDSQRYKQAGNSVTVNVIEAIGAELQKRMS